jgi:hypothetical protein
MKRRNALRRSIDASRQSARTEMQEFLDRQIFWNPKFESKNTQQLTTEYDA